MDLAVSLIRTDGGTQPRATLDQNVTQDYAQAMLEGIEFPPVTVFYDGTNYWLADGFHRYHATCQICHESIVAEIRQGTRRDAVLYSVAANSTHGLRRTNADKRRAVETLLCDEEWARWSDREVARRCGVDHVFVGRIRSSLVTITSEERTYTTKHGTVATMSTANIGQQQNTLPTPTINEILTRNEAYRPSFEQWQKGNLELGLDEWSDPLPSCPTTTLTFQHSTHLPILDRPPVIQATMPPPSVLDDGSETKEKRDTHFMQIMSSSETPEWYTPRHIIERVITFFGEIDLDPCSNSHEDPNVPARTLYAKEDDGLAQQWHGRVYMNPPYGSEIGKWTAKLVESYQREDIEEAIALVPGRIDTAWFQPLYEHLICNIRGRLQFGEALTGAPFPSVIVYLGERVADFIEAFAAFGPIVRRIA